MNWHIFGILAFVMLALERGLHPLLSVGDSVSPSFLLILLVYVGMFAPPITAAWAAVTLGLLVDVTHALPLMPPVGLKPILGPHALGYLVGAYVLIQLRGMIFRGSPITMAIVVFLVGLFVSLTAVVLLTLRGLIVEPIIAFSPGEDLVHRFLQLLYTSVMALPVGYLLSKATPLFAFVHAKSR